MTANNFNTQSSRLFCLNYTNYTNVLKQIQVENQTFSVLQPAIFSLLSRTAELKDECVMCGNLGVVFTGLTPQSQLHRLLIGPHFLLKLLLTVNLETNPGQF